MKPIYVTQPSLPPLEEFSKYLQVIWDRKILTNNGEFHQQFERNLCRFLEANQCNLFSNATLALLVAFQALELSGEVITTPYSFVATTHALHWNGLRPVFCDIRPDTCNIDSSRIEELITPQTTAILPVHVYGNPCEIGDIQKIADTHGLKVIYDAAHAFGVSFKGQSILNHGDLSIVSFHATKVFQTFEGGAIIHQNSDLKTRIDYLKNFGFTGETSICAVGINAKMNEFQAALGVIQLEYVRKEIEKRRSVTERYRQNLKSVDGIRIMEIPPEVEHNYSYFPIFVDPHAFGTSREVIYDELHHHSVFSRRYFYPLISHFSPYRDLPSASPTHLPVAERIAGEVLCLPIYGSLELADVDRISEIILKIHREKS